MADYEYEEENLDDFMINAANVLSEDNNPEKGSIIESLKQHLSSIFHIQSEMENFFRTLNGVIFTTKDSSKNTGQMIDNKEPFVLYPLISLIIILDHYNKVYVKRIDQTLLF